MLIKDQYKRSNSKELTEMLNNLEKIIDMEKITYKVNYFQYIFLLNKRLFKILK